MTTADTAAIPTLSATAPSAAPTTAPLAASSAGPTTAPTTAALAELADVVARFTALVSRRLPDDVTARLKALAEEETNPMAMMIYRTMQRNQELAEKLKRPSCQDTGLVQIFQHIYAAKQAANSTLEILGTPELATPTTRAALTADPSLIEVDDITFGYEPDNPVVKGVTLTCRPGTVTALVGPSGGGKSTLAKLIARFWDVDSGAIRIGGADVREQTDEQLMGSMALVFQDAMIASDTIANNIALGKPEATREQVVEAARKAHVHDRITALPNGYDTMLGTGDGFLSGGEEQRLGIARAFLSAPRILILDEATAQADAHSELEIQRAISGLAEGRTVVMIAHRLSTIRTADQIAVIDEGRITECGSHDELISRDGHYARLWAAQQNTMTGGRDA